MVDTEVQSTGAPYTDTFKLRMRSIFTNKGSNTVKLDIVIEMEWLKKTMMKSMVQKQAFGETKMANEVYLTILNEAIKMYPQVTVQRPIKVKKVKVVKPSNRRQNLNYKEDIGDNFLPLQSTVQKKSEDE